MIRVKVKEVAQAKKMSIAKLARKADLDYKTVNRLVHDPYAEVSTVTLGRIAEALEVSIHDLLEDVPSDGTATE